MKTTLLPHAIQNLKSAIKLKGIFAFLIIFFMSVSSFGQLPGQLTGQYGIEFVFDDCFGDTITVKFVAPDISGTNYVYPVGGAFNSLEQEVQINWVVEYNDTLTGWELLGPTNPDGSGALISFFFSSSTAAFPSNDENNWPESNAGGGFACTLNNIIYTALPGDPDNDLDDFPASVDCDDSDSTVNPGADEILHDTIDNDCNPATPDNDGSNVFVFCNDAETKVLICHNGMDKCVSINAVDAHLAHDDTLGPCSAPITDNQEDPADVQAITEVIPTTAEVVFWPNPSNNLFNVKMITPNFEDKVDFQVFDINGRLIHSELINANENYQFGNKLSAGVYFVKMSQSNNSKVMKVIKL